MGIASLDTSGPTSSNLLSTGAADIRALRTAIRESFVNFGIGTDVVTATAAQINGAPNKAGAETISGAWNFTGAATFANPVVAPVGSVSAASFSFTGETNTGVYKRGGGQVGFAVAGAEAGWFGSTGLDIRNPGGSWAGIGFWYGADRRALIDVDLANGQFAAYPVIGSGAGTYGAPIWRYDPTGTGQTDFGYQVRLPDGSAAKPGVGFTSENTTGFWRVAGGQVGLSLGGTNRYIFDTVGISSPTVPFSSANRTYCANLATLDEALAEIASTASLHKDPHTLAGTASEVGSTWTVNPNAPAVGTSVTATTNGRLTANADGVYRVDLSCSVSLAAGVTSIMGIRKNGSALAGSAQQTVSSTDGGLVPFSSSVLVSLNSTDYVSLYAYAPSGVGTLYNAQFLMQRIA